MTSISWAKKAINPVTGCFPASAGCGHCYAVGQSYRYGHIASTAEKYANVAEKSAAGNIKFTGKVNFHEPAIYKVFDWKKTQYIFWGSMADLFYKKVKKEWLDKIFAAALLAPRHVSMFLTKRPARMRQYIEERFAGENMIREMEAMRLKYDEFEHMLRNYVELYPKDQECECQDCLEDTSPCQNKVLTKGTYCSVGYDPNAIYRVVTENVQHIWFGTSVENQEQADLRIPELVAIGQPGVKFLSMEPLLGPVDLTKYIDQIDYVILGGESGHQARPMHPDWVRQIIELCQKHNKIVHFKQWGHWLPWESTAQPPYFCSQKGVEKDVGLLDLSLENAEWNTKRWHSPDLLDFALHKPQKPLDYPIDYQVWYEKVGKKHSGEKVDGKLYQNFPPVPDYCLNYK